MNNSPADLRIASEGELTRIESLRTIDRFACQAILNYRCAERHWRVLIADPLRLPQLHAAIWAALNPDLRRSAVAQASRPIQHWLSSLLMVSLELLDIVLCEQVVDGELLLNRLTHRFDERVECSFALQARVGLLLGARSPALSRPELGSIQTGDFIRIQAFFLRFGRNREFTVSPSGQTITLTAAFSKLVDDGNSSSDLTAKSKWHKPGLDTEVDTGFEVEIETAIESAIEVEIEITVVPIRIDTLANMRPGYTLMTPFRLDGAGVSIVTDSRVMGRGRLISIGEVSGVRISDWVGSCLNPNAQASVPLGAC